MSRWSKYVLPFGKHKGKPLDEVPLLYLDWLVGQEVKGFLGMILKEYLNGPTIKAQLDKELEEDG